MPDGRYLLLYKAVAARNPLPFGGPVTHLTAAGRSLALFVSADGSQWRPAPSPLVSATRTRWDNSETEKLHRLERPQVRLKHRRPRVLYRAASPDSSESHSINVHTPLGG